MVQLITFPTSSQTAFGGGPNKNAVCRKSESFVMMQKWSAKTPCRSGTSFRETFRSSKSFTQEFRGEVGPGSNYETSQSTTEEGIGNHDNGDWRSRRVLFARMNSKWTPTFSAFKAFHSGCSNGLG